MSFEGFESHKALSLFAPQYKLVEIATHLEKRSSLRSALTSIQKAVGHVIYAPVKDILFPAVQKILHP